MCVHCMLCLFSVCVYACVSMCVCILVCAATPSAELLMPVPHIPIGAIPPDDDQKGTGFFIGGMSMKHFQDLPVTPRRYTFIDCCVYNLRR